MIALYVCCYEFSLIVPRVYFGDAVSIFMNIKAALGSIPIPFYVVTSNATNNRRTILNPNFLLYPLSRLYLFPNRLFLTDCRGSLLLIFKCIANRHKEPEKVLILPYISHIYPILFLIFIYSFIPYKLSHFTTFFYFLTYT